MSILRLSWILLLAGCIAAAAQPPLAERGAWALGGFGLPFGNGGGGLSVWRIYSANTSVGVEGSLAWRYEDTSKKCCNLDPDKVSQTHRLLVRLCPTLKRYRPLRHGVAPYLYGQVRSGFSGYGSELDSGNLNTRYTVDLGVALGLGADWFPFQRISIGGQAGLGLDYSFSEFGAKHRTTGLLDTGSNWDLSLATFLSELTVLVYF